MHPRLPELMNERFPFLESRDIDLILTCCEKNNGLVYYPQDWPAGVVGFYRFFPELIYVVEAQNYDILMNCDLTHGPLIYVAVLILPEGESYSAIRKIARVLNARAYAFHRYKNDEWRFHFFKSSVCSETQRASVH